MTDPSAPIDYFKKAAKALLRRMRRGDAAACRAARAAFINCREKTDAAIASDFTLMQAQHLVGLEHGFPKWQDLARASAIELRLVITMAKFPDLNAHGVGLYPHHERLPVAERQKFFTDERDELRKSVDRVEATLEWLQKNIRRIKTINLTHTSYGLKHIAEKEIGYIPNGVFIAAAVIAGYPYRRIEKPKMAFAMSERSIRESAKRTGYAV